MKKDCTKCKHGVTLVGAHTRTHYIECEFERKFCEEKHTLEEIMAANEIDFCNYEKGTPTDGGVTYDD